MQQALLGFGLDEEAAAHRHQAAILAPPRLANHLPPDSIALPGDVLALVQLELTPSLSAITMRDATRIEVNERRDLAIQFVLRRLLERNCLLDDIVQVPVLKVAVRDLVIPRSFRSVGSCERQRVDALLQNLAETRVVQLDVRPKRRREHVEVRDLALEQQLRIPCVVVPGRPDSLRSGRTRRDDAVPELACKRPSSDEGRLACTTTSSNVGIKGRRACFQIILLV